MEALFVANIEYDENEGICKKITAQSAAIGKNVGRCRLIMKTQVGSVIKDIVNPDDEKSSKSVLETALGLVQKDQIDILYIRLMVPSFKLIKLMKTAQKSGTRVYYEIPTYPYYAEQFRSSTKKYRAVAKICLDVAFSPFIRKNTTNIVAIKSNSSVHMYPNMLEITNGVRTDNIAAKNYDKPWDGIFRMVTVGTLYPYHGYDRILKGLAECEEMIGNIPVEFHVIGSSPTIDKLHKEANELHLSRVYFHGVKSTEELNELYESFDVGLGCLALHRRNADIDTTLKIVEYYCRGVPVVTTGVVPEEMQKYSIIMPDDETSLDIGEIYNEFKKIDRKSLSVLSKEAKCFYDWDSIMNRILSKSK